MPARSGRAALESSAACAIACGTFSSPAIALASLPPSAATARTSYQVCSQWRASCRQTGVPPGDPLERNLADLGGQRMLGGARRVELDAPEAAPEPAGVAGA